MQNFTLNIDSSAVARHTEQLRQLHRSALPVAIRGSLSKAAMNVKQDTMPKSSNIFIKRNPTFFKSTSNVDFAKGFDVNTMRATVGFMPQSGAKETGGATTDLQQQEQRGKIGHRSFIPLASARTGNAWSKNVKAAMRTKAIMSKIVDSKDINAKTKKGQFMASARHAGKGGFLIGNNLSKNGNKLLWFIKSVDKNKVKAIPIYSVRSHRNVAVKATNFMRNASLKSSLRIEQYFIQEAEKQIAKYK